MANTLTNTIGLEVGHPVDINIKVVGIFTGVLPDYFPKHPMNQSLFKSAYEYHLHMPMINTSLHKNTNPAADFYLLSMYIASTLNNM